MPSRFCIEEEHWNPYKHTCEPCRKRFPTQKGFEFSENCGLDDHGHQVHDHYRRCKDGTFNTGSSFICQKCNSCPSEGLTASQCTAETDVVCCGGQQDVVNGRCADRPAKTTVIPTVSRRDVTSVSITYPSSSISSIPLISLGTSSLPLMQNIQNTINVAAISVCVVILLVLALLCLVIFRKRWTKHFRQGQNNRMFLSEQSYKGEMREILKSSIKQTDIYYNANDNSNTDCLLNVSSSSNNQLAHEIQAAPLKTVLNNLDVLEELVLLLDPDISGAKSTRHLAAQCSFSFTWINYAYSMKDHKSPLVTVLEGVVAKNPDWTVGHFAELLTGIGRNDAVETLAKLSLQ